MRLPATADAGPGGELVIAYAAATGVHEPLSTRSMTYGVRWRAGARVRLPMTA